MVEMQQVPANGSRGSKPFNAILDLFLCEFDTFDQSRFLGEATLGIRNATAGKLIIERGEFRSSDGKVAQFLGRIDAEILLGILCLCELGRRLRFATTFCFGTQGFELCCLRRDQVFLVLDTKRGKVECKFRAKLRKFGLNSLLGVLQKKLA